MALLLGISTSMLGLIEDDVRPVLFHPRAAVCNQPWVKGMTQMVNGIYNGSRFEDVWLDK